MNTVLIIGSNGQLGSEINYLKNNYSTLKFVFLDLPDIDITSEKSLNEVFEKSKPDYVINCAAYTAVDKAESEAEIVQKINVFGPGLLAEKVESSGAVLFHISTDFVFDGRNFQPYVESDIVNPISVYGKTKANGETEVLNKSKKSIVIRTSWLYSFFGNNFVKTMIHLGQDRDELNVISDQIGSPTWARDLAKVILDSIVGGMRLWEDENRIYHYSNEGVASWYDFAFEIMNVKNLNCTINPIPTEAYPTPAKRPHYSLMDKSKIKNKITLSIPHWKVSLTQCLEDFKKV